MGKRTANGSQSQGTIEPAIRPASLISSFLEALNKHERTVITLLALAVGIVVGYLSILFRLSIEAVEWSAFSGVGPAGGLEWWRRMLPPTLCLTVMAMTVRYIAKEATGHGVPEVMLAVALRGGLIRMRVIIVKFIASALTLGCGGSAGQAGPIAHVGASTGSAIGQLLHVSRRRLMLMVGCGAAAGISATFNAPVAGVLLVLEVMIGEYGALALGPVVISSVIATVISRAHLGNSPAFYIPDALRAFTWASLWEIGTFLLLGLIAGAVGVLFSRAIFKATDIFETMKVPLPIKALGGAVIVGVMVTLVPHVGGIGQKTVEALMSGDLSTVSTGSTAVSLLQGGWMLVAALLLFKLLATATTLGIGGSGGVFSPSLFIGASTGYLVGMALHALAPGMVSDPSAYALVGMGAVVAATTHAPMTSIIIIFEMTGDYRIILPLMLACIASTLLASKLDPESIYTRKLARRGIMLREGREETVLAGITVAEVMHTDVTTVRQSTPYPELVRIMTSSKDLYFPVVDRNGLMTGIITYYDLRGHMFDDELGSLVIAHDLATPEVVTLSPEDNLLTAFERFNSIDVEKLPVVDPRDPRRVVGMVSRGDLLNRYNAAVLHRDFEGGS